MATPANATTTPNAAITKPAEDALTKVPQASTELFAGAEDWSTAQRIAQALAKSTLVPKEYQNNIPNVLIAMEIAGRVKASVFAVMQSLDVIHGRPSWRAQFLIATVNKCGRFTPLRFRFSGTKGKLDFGCCAVANDIHTGEELEGETITMQMAQDEGWSTKNGSKYKTMSGQMLRYRSAAFWTRVYAPELSLGMQTSDEVQDVYGAASHDMPQGLNPGSAAALEAALGMPPRAAAIDTEGEPAQASDASAADVDENGEVLPAQQTIDTCSPRKR